jgi:hypothetical protein
MAAEIQKGKAVIWGIANDGTVISMTGYATFTLESAKGSHKFKMDEVKDEAGFDKALIATNGHVELDIIFCPTADTKTLVKDLAVFLAPLAKVTLAHFKIATYNGDWVYVGDESIDLSAGKEAKMSLKIRKYDDTAQNDSLTTTVI